MQKLVSCILPTYNRPNWLEICLYNLKWQEYKNIEIIVVDDGSNVNNLEIVDKFNSEQFPIKYIKLEENSGTVSIPRNIGISYATGEILAHIDDDCISDRTKFTQLVPLMKDNIVLAYGGRKTYDVTFTKNMKIVENLSLRNESKTNEFVNHKKAVGIDNGQFIYRADVYDKIDPVFAINACDWETYKSIADLGDFAFCDSCVCHYMWHGGNISLTPKQKRVNPYDKLENYLKYFNCGKFLEKVMKNVRCKK